MKNNVSLPELFVPLYAYALKSKAFAEKNEDVEAKELLDDMVAGIDALIKKVNESDWGRFYEGLFALCAYIDELFLASTSAKLVDVWQRNPLQLHYFNTTNGGVIFFEKMKAVSDDPEVKRIYEYSIALGFKGVHYDEEVDAKEPVEDESQRIDKQQAGIFDMAYDGSVAATKNTSNLSGFDKVLYVVIPPVVFIGLYLSFQSALMKEIHTILGTGQ